MTQKLEVHTDLMSPAGVEERRGQSGTAEPLQHGVTRVGFPAELFVHRHAFAMRSMPGNGRPNFAPVSGQFTANNRVISLFDAAAGELSRQSQVRIVVFGHYQATAGVFIQAMDNARTGNSADAAQLTLAMVEQGINQRAGLVA